MAAASWFDGMVNGKLRCGMRLTQLQWASGFRRRHPRSSLQFKNQRQCCPTANGNVASRDLSEKGVLQANNSKACGAAVLPLGLRQANISIAVTEP
jgi:hypothetical protein